MKRLILPLLTIAAVVAVAAPFADNDRVALLGDSVTHWGYYTSQIQNYYYTRFPDKDIQIWNCGVGGNTVDEAMCRLEGDLFARKPTAVSILFGMNDVGVDGYRTNAPAWAIAARPKRYSIFTNDVRKLKASLDKGCPHAKLTWCTPVPWDDELKFKSERAPIKGVTAAERPMAAFIRAYRDKVGGGFIDYYEPMLEYNTNLHRRDPYASLSPDTIHPREPGGLFMARLFLKAQGAPGLVSDVAVDAASGKVTAAANASVADMKKTADGGVSFTLLEKALPFPVEPVARAIADELGFDDEFNREILSVKGLVDGNWTLAIDGSNILTKTAAEWATGVNLATRETTPMMIHARAVAKLNAERVAKEKIVRMLWVARTVLWRRIRWDGYTLDDLDNPKVYNAFLIGFFNSLGKDGRHPDQNMYDDFRRNWKNRAQNENEIEKLHLRIRTAAQPKPHRFVLVPAR